MVLKIRRNYNVDIIYTHLTIDVLSETHRVQYSMEVAFTFSQVFIRAGSLNHLVMPLPLPPLLLLLLLLLLPLTLLTPLPLLKLPIKHGSLDHC